MNKFNRLLLGALSSLAFQMPYPAHLQGFGPSNQHRGLRRSRYMPHQGERECARRRAKLELAGAAS